LTRSRRKKKLTDSSHKRKADRRNRADILDMDGMCTVVVQSPDTPVEPDTPAAPTSPVTPIEAKILRKSKTAEREVDTAERRRLRDERAQVIDDGMVTVLMRSPDTPLEAEAGAEMKAQSSVSAARPTVEPAAEPVAERVRGKVQTKRETKMVYKEAVSEVKMKLDDSSSDWLNDFHVASSRETESKVPHAKIVPKIAPAKAKQTKLQPPPPPPKIVKAQQHEPKRNEPPRDYLIASDLTSLTGGATPDKPFKQISPMDRGIFSPKDDGLAEEEASLSKIVFDIELEKSVSYSDGFTQSTPSQVGYKRLPTPESIKRARMPPPQLKRLMIKERQKPMEDVQIEEPARAPHASTSPLHSALKVLCVFSVLAFLTLGAIPFVSFDSGSAVTHSEPTTVRGGLHKDTSSFKQYVNPQRERPRAIFVTESLDKQEGSAKWFHPKKIPSNKHRVEFERDLAEHKANVPAVVHIKARSLVVFKHRLREVVQGDRFKRGVKEGTKLLAVALGASLIGRGGVAARLGGKLGGKVIKWVVQRKLLGRVDWAGLAGATGGMVAYTWQALRDGK
jgi:hypothetical protein